MNLSLAWEKTSRSVARFRMEIEDESFEFDGTYVIDSLSELANAVCRVAVEGKEADVAFENEPGQHLLKLNPLGDGRVEIKLSWVANPYGSTKKHKNEKVLYSGKIILSELIEAVCSMLQSTKEQCNNSQRTLGDFKFPTASMRILENA